MIFTIASFFNFLGPLILGLVLDHYGPRVCSLVSIALVGLGSLLFSVSDSENFPLFVPAMCLIAFGGPGAQSSIIHLSNLFPTWKATATAFITGSFQLSFVIFLIFDQLWFHKQFTYTQLFMGYCGLCAVNAVVSMVMWPDQPYSYEEVVEVDHIEDAEDNLQHLGHIRLPSVFIHHSEFQMMEQGKKPLPSVTSNRVMRPAKAPISVDLKDASLLEQLKSPEFILLTVFFLVNSFWVNFYIGTFDAQIRDGTALTVAEEHVYAQIFTLTITLGVIGIPIVGACMDYLGFPITSTILLCLGIVWAFLAIQRDPSTLVFSFVFYSAFRTFFFTFTFAYLADTLGFKYFGVLAGVMFVLGGVIGVLQYPLAEFAVRRCKVHPLTQVEVCTDGLWSQVNCVMLVTIASTLYFSYHDYVRRKLPNAGRVLRQESSSQESSLLLPRRSLLQRESSSSKTAYGTA